jgi:Na+-transporting NADH:ubiquinone oxidoreductase subunit NqrF
MNRKLLAVLTGVLVAGIVLTGCSHSAPSPAPPQILDAIQQAVESDSPPPQKPGDSSSSTTWNHSPGDKITVTGVHYGPASDFQLKQPLNDVPAGTTMYFHVVNYIRTKPDGSTMHEYRWFYVCQKPSGQWQFVEQPRPSD